MVKLPENLVKARFLSRPNRFTVVAEGEGGPFTAFLADPGRLTELLLPGTELFLAPAKESAGRKTLYDVVLAYRGGIFISLDSRLPNRLFAAAFHGRKLVPFIGYRELTSEVKTGSSRLDFLLTGSEPKLPPCYVEVKSVTLVSDGNVALFPDAPTARGTRHLEELMGLKYRGCRAAVVFIIQREDADFFAPNESTDPLFARALRQAAEAGVEIYAYRCRISLKAACLADAVPVRLDVNF
ncbi:Sugar fermentation stimulation protein A [Moorella humiferrea]